MPLNASISSSHSRSAATSPLPSEPTATPSPSGQINHKASASPPMINSPSPPHWEPTCACISSKFSSLFLIGDLRRFNVCRRGDSSSPSSTFVPSVLSRFQLYLRINTAEPYPNYQEAADFLISQAKFLSVHPQLLEFVSGKPLVLLRWPGMNPSLPSILLNSHTDVVPLRTTSGPKVYIEIGFAR